MKKEAYADSTMRAVGKRLEYLAKNCMLGVPEVVKGFVAQKDCSNAFKETLVEAYDLYCRANNIVWKKPFYERYDKMPKIPSEEKLNMIIAKASKNFALVFSMMELFASHYGSLAWSGESTRPCIRAIINAQNSKSSLIVQLAVGISVIRNPQASKPWDHIFAYGLRPIAH